MPIICGDGRKKGSKNKPKEPVPEGYIPQPKKKKPINTWIQFVKDITDETGRKYTDVIKDPKTKQMYKNFMNSLDPQPYQEDDEELIFEYSPISEDEEEHTFEEIGYELKEALPKPKVKKYKPIRRDWEKAIKMLGEKRQVAYNNFINEMEQTKQEISNLGLSVDEYATITEEINGLEMELNQILGKKKTIEPNMFSDWFDPLGYEEEGSGIKKRRKNKK